MNLQLLENPKSIAVIGGSDNPHTPGGKVLQNLLKGNFKGEIFVVNRNRKNVMNLPTFSSVEELPEVELAIIAIPAKFIEEAVKVLTEKKKTKAFIIFSAGFSDTSAEGKEVEKRITEQIRKYNGVLLGPNNIGLLNKNYAGIFTTPVPEISENGVDFISASGATAVFIIEYATLLGLKFHSVWSVGNSAMVGVEEVLEYFNNKYNPEDAKTILLYIESIKNPQKLLITATALRKKGFKIIAIKSGTSEAGSRAASSHTGALASSDIAVNALFEKAGIIRAYGRYELVYLAGIMNYGVPEGRNVAIITHAGGPAVMLTDTLENNGLKVPYLGDSPEMKKLSEELFLGSSVNNPVDFLATGTAEQLDKILQTVSKLQDIDSIPVIFGSPGLFPVYEVYDVLMKHIKTSEKPIYPILPSLVNVKQELEYFHKQGFVSFPDEVLFGKALAKAFNSPEPDVVNIKEISPEWFSHSGILSEDLTYKLLEENDFPVVKTAIFEDIQEALEFAENKFPVVLKITGETHKTEHNGVILNIKTKQEFIKAFKKLRRISNKILVQEMIKGYELFIGIKYEKTFGHLLFFGSGGIYIEVYKDFASLLLPASRKRIQEKLKALKVYKILKGIRGNPANIDAFIDLVYKLNFLVKKYPNIEELDFNPVIVNNKETKIVDFVVKFRSY